MERVVTLNIYQAKQAAYRGLDILPGECHKCTSTTYKMILLVKVISWVGVTN